MNCILQPNSDRMHSKLIYFTAGLAVMLLAACAPVRRIAAGYADAAAVAGDIAYNTGSSVYCTGQQLGVTLLGCTGNRAAQTVYLTLEVYNYGTTIRNASFGRGHCGGDPTLSNAYDNYGRLYDVGRCSGYHNAAVPTRVPVRFTVEISGVSPQTGSFPYIRLSNSVGTDNDNDDIILRNIPIIWQ